METLRDLYVDELKDLWSAEKQILRHGSMCCGWNGYSNHSSNVLAGRSASG